MISVVKLSTTVLKLTVVLFIAFWFTQDTFAQTTIPATELDGYAWSSTIGWISLNCRTGGATGNNICATRSDYKVSINADRTISGYAWSSSIGWIKFDGLSSFPTGGGTTATSSRVGGTFPNLVFQGWARACAGTNAPNTSEAKNCSTMALNNNSGDWDGWISLRGNGYIIGTSNAGMNPLSYAWGGSVLGWIDMFTEVTWVNLNPAAYVIVPNCVITVAGVGTCTSTTSWSIVNATTVPNLFNTTPLINATSSNQAVGTTSRTLRLGNNRFAARDGLVELAFQTGVASCGAGLVASGTLCQNPVVVSTVPTVTISANKRIARAGDTVTLTWGISSFNPAADTCTVSGPGVLASIPVPLVTSRSGTIVSGPLRSKSQFTITCTDGTDTNTATVDVELIPTTREV